MSIRSKSKPVKSGEEGKSWFGKIKRVFYTEKTIALPPKQKRSYNRTSDKQIREMLRLRKTSPNLSHKQIAKLVDVTEEVADYWLGQKESTVLANLRARKGRKVADKKRKERVRVAQEKKKAKSAKPKPKTITFASQEETEITLSTFAKLSEQEGQKILKQVNKEKHPIHHKADPKHFKGALPSQAVATEEEWKQEDRKYKIGKAVMHKAIKQKETEEKRKDRLQKEHQQKLADGTLKIHFDSCPSCNRNSKLSVKEYCNLVYKEHLKQKEYALNKQKKQLDQRQKQLDEMEKESLGNVAERAKEGHKLCLTCSKPIDYPQESRCKGIWGVGQWYCADHEPPKPNGDKK